jgi:hypothetical protein
MKERSWLRGQTIVAVLFAVACGSAPPIVASSTASPIASSSTTVSPGPTPTATANPTAQLSPTPSPYSPPPSPTPSAILDGKFGVLVPKYYSNEPIPGPIGVSVRRETDLQLLFTLITGSGQQAAVSPDSYHAAYWVKTELRVIDIAPNARPRTLLTVSAKGENGYNMAWSSDSTGIVIGVNGAPAIPAADAPPAYTAIRTIDVSGGLPREIARIAGANVVPLAWDRSAHLVAAYEPVCCGTMNYDTITEDGVVTRTKPDFDLFFFKASQEAKFVFGTKMVLSNCPCVTTALRVWPVDSYAAGITMRSIGSKPIRAAEWRPGTGEIAVLFDDRLELWTPTGSRRTISLPNLPKLSPTAPNANLLFRADGNAVFISLAIGSGGNSFAVVGLDLDSGASEVVDWVGYAPAPGTSVRITAAGI